MLTPSSEKPGHLAPGRLSLGGTVAENGWGFVLLLNGHVFYDYGVIRPEHLAPFAARQAFIYVLEIVRSCLWFLCSLRFVLLCFNWHAPCMARTTAKPQLRMHARFSSLHSNFHALAFHAFALH